MSDVFISSLAAAARFLPAAVLLWLAFFFGRTLRAGATPLIERIARRGKPVLSAALCRYTRGLTAVWSVYFVLAAAAGVLVDAGLRRSDPTVAAASLLLFVGEYWLRRRLFAGEQFPGLLQQVRDTASVWRRRREP